MKNPLNSFRRKIGEQITSVTDSLRSSFRSLGREVWPRIPLYDNSKVDYDLARKLYRNDDSKLNLGSGFSRIIIDTTVAFIGIPHVKGGDNELNDNFLNECLQNYWRAELQQMVRDSCRDSKVIVRVRQHSFEDPLVAQAERDHCYLEIVPPERCRILYDPDNAEIIHMALIDFRNEVPRENFEEQLKRGRTISEPQVILEDIVEVITADSFRYFNVTRGEWMDDWERVNKWGFVPLVEVFNEYDASLSGGQSDLEGAYPFILAFHDVLGQALAAHKYHSIPKIKLKVHDVISFLTNNFPDVIDQTTGQVKSGSKISWRGTEILFMLQDEDASFLEAQSVLGDSKTLLEFLLDCISIASETPEWAFMRVEGAGTGQLNAQTMPFMKKMDRKRGNFQPYFQRLLKMVMVIRGIAPNKPSLQWEPVRVEEFSTWAQAVQFLIMGLEVAVQRRIISKRTYRETLRTYLPSMRGPDEEEREADADAKEDAQFEADLPQPPANQNGKGDTANVPEVVNAGGGRNE